MAFNLGRSALWPLRAPRARNGFRLLEVAAVGAVTVLAMVALAATAGRWAPHTGGIACASESALFVHPRLPQQTLFPLPCSCLDVPEEWDALDAVQLWCGPEQYNDLGSGFLSSGFFVVKTLLGLGSEAEPLAPRGPRYFMPPSLAVLAASYLCCMVVASNVALPGGIFLPSILTGASFGALCGSGLTAALPESWGLEPGLYALVGATAMLGGVFRSSISLVVIVVEGGQGKAGNMLLWALHPANKHDPAFILFCRHPGHRLPWGHYRRSNCLELDRTPPDHERGVRG